MTAPKKNPQGESPFRDILNNATPPKSTPGGKCNPEKTRCSEEVWACSEPVFSLNKRKTFTSVSEIYRYAIKNDLSIQDLDLVVLRRKPVYLQTISPEDLLMSKDKRTDNRNFFPETVRAALEQFNAIIRAETPIDSCSVFVPVSIPSCAYSMDEGGGKVQNKDDSLRISSYSEEVDVEGQSYSYGPETGIEQKYEGSCADFAINERELEKAEQQILGFIEAKRGGTLTSLIRSMGLAIEEFEGMVSLKMVTYLREDELKEIRYNCREEEGSNEKYL